MIAPSVFERWSCNMPAPYRSSRISQVRQILALVLVLNLAVALAKFVYGVMTSSNSMQADGIHSVFDSLGNVVGLVGITLALRPADAGHPYGHHKFETYASLAIGVLLVCAAAEVGFGAVSSLASGVHNTQVTVVSYAVMLGTLCVNVGVTAYERKEGKRLNSDILLADASHTLSDAMVSIGVIIGLVLVQAGFAIADSIMALVVMVAILFTAIDVFRAAFETLSDKARIPEEDLKGVVLAVPGVKDVHQIRTRGTSGDVYADMHVLVDPQMTVAVSHEVADRVESEVVHKFPQVKDILVHVEPNDAYHRIER